MNRCRHVPTRRWTVAPIDLATLTRGPWHLDHQHAGPPIALVCRAIERAARGHGLEQLSRLTANLLRPVPIGDLEVAVSVDYAGRNAAHFSARLTAGGKDIALFTALAQRENDVELPDDLPGHPLPHAPQNPDDSPVATFPFAGRPRRLRGPGGDTRRPRPPFRRPVRDLVPAALPLGRGRGTERLSARRGRRRFRQRHQRDPRYLPLQLRQSRPYASISLRRPAGEWICLDARTCLGPSGCGLAESMIFDLDGLIGRATRSLSIRARK